MKNILASLLLISFSTSAFARPPVSVPETSSLILLGFGLLGLFLAGRKK